MLRIPRTSGRDRRGATNVIGNRSVPRDLSQQELGRLAEYFSILRKWSLEIQCNDLQGHDDAPGSQSDDFFNETKKRIKNSIQENG